MQSEELKERISKAISSLEEVSAKENPSCGGLCVRALRVLVVVAIACAPLHYHHIQEQHKTFAYVDTQILRLEMVSKLHGQHIAVDMVSENMRRYLATHLVKTVMEDEDTCLIPPLVLSFHGCPGVGKTFLSNLIPCAFPAKNVVSFVISYHFPPSQKYSYDRGT
ncbi:hypothetical protein ACOMHN_060330 [Nucella lapillus]